MKDHDQTVLTSDIYNTLKMGGVPAAIREKAVNAISIGEAVANAIVRAIKGFKHPTTGHA